MNDLPAFTSSNISTATSTLSNMVGGGSLTIGGNAGAIVGGRDDFAAYRQVFHNQPGLSQGAPMSAPVQIKSKLRIVRVFLVDADDRVPADKRILFRSDELTTDATDQELYFDIPVNDLLKKHNTVRATVEWEEKTGDGTKTRTGLKDARIRDLVMSITTIAQF